MAAISSIEGYCPVISYLKIINFFVFIAGLCLGTKRIDRHPRDLRQIRCAILAIIALLTYGSLLTLPFPSIAYFTSLKDIVIEHGTQYADEAFHEYTGSAGLFTGITAHSQFLGPVLACAFAWLLCDMLLVERAFSPIHIALLVPIPVLAYMTRSRLAFVVLASSMAMVGAYCIPYSAIPQRLQARFSSGMVLMAFLLLVAASVFELQNGTVSKWLRKTDEVALDSRSLGEAVTESRLGLIQKNVRDFKRSIILGSGFQVDDLTKTKYQSGQVSLFSASIEKGLLPLMILGETGLAGGIVFALFLITFYVKCHARRFTATLTLFTVYLSSNMAEATFFAPSGGGGVLWILMVVGGFVIDMSRLADRRAKALTALYEDCDQWTISSQDEDCSYSEPQFRTG